MPPMLQEDRVNLHRDDVTDYHPGGDGLWIGHGKEKQVCSGRKAAQQDG